MPKVDLATTIVPSDHKVWKLFPGEGYKFDRLINGNNIAFLDVRNLDRLAGSSLKWDRKRLENLVSQDRWARQVAATGIRTDRRISPGDKSTATYVDGLLNVAKKGDFILVPSRGPDGKANVFELTSGPGSVSRLEARDGRFDNIYLGRKIHWIGSINKRQFDYAVVELLQTPVAFFDMGNTGRSQIYEEVLGNYIFRGENVATYRIGKSEYNSRDNRVVSTWMEFVDLAANDNAFEAALKRVRGHAISSILDSSSLSEEDRSDLSININSPGEIVMAAARFAPLIGLAMFPLAVEGVSYNDAISAQTHLTVLGGAVDDCTAQIDQSVQDIIRAMGAEKWLEACELAQSANKNAELTTDASLE